MRWEPAEEDTDKENDDQDEDVLVEAVVEHFMTTFALAVSSREMEEETVNEACYQSLLDQQQEQEVKVAVPTAITYM